MPKEVPKIEAPDFTPALKVLLGMNRPAEDGEIVLDKNQAYPLRWASGTEVKEASIECLESWSLPYFPYTETIAAIQHWATKVKPEGLLRIVVPNMQAIVRGFMKGMGSQLFPLLHGPQTTPDECFRCSFDEAGLAETMRMAGLIDVKPFRATDTLVYLEGQKPKEPIQNDSRLKIGAVISVPRLGFMDNFGCVYEALGPLGIPFRRCGGASWGVSLQCAIEETLRIVNPDVILTLDYDTVFTATDVKDLERLLREFPEVDAIAPLQSNRHNQEPLFAMELPHGVRSHAELPVSVFNHSIVKVQRAHFGLTMIRASALAKVPKPWFHGHAAPDGTWTDGKLDDDTSFWTKFEAVGLKLFLAPRVKVGHIVEMVRWPGKTYQATHQTIEDYRKKGKPDALD